MRTHRVDGTDATHLPDYPPAIESPPNGRNEPGCQLVSDVQAFSRRHSLESYLELAKDLARTTLGATEVRAVLKVDGDTGDEWISVIANVRGSTADLLAASQRYTADWVAKVPSPQRHLFCLALDIA